MLKDTKIWTIIFTMAILLIYLMGCQSSFGPVQTTVDTENGQDDHQAPALAGENPANSPGLETIKSLDVVMEKYGWKLPEIPVKGFMESSEDRTFPDKAGIYLPEPLDRDQTGLSGASLDDATRREKSGINGLQTLDSLDTRLDLLRALPAEGSIQFVVVTPFPVIAGEEVVVDIIVTGITDLFGFGLRAGYQPDNVSPVDVDLSGSRLGDDLISFSDVFDPGELPIGVTRKRSDDGILYGISGDGLLATIHFTALADLSSLNDLDLEFLTNTNLPRYTRSDLSEARFILNQEVVSQ